MNPADKIILISGANGFLGGALCRHFHARGYKVRALVRHPEKAGDIQKYASAGIYQCDLPDAIDEAAFHGEIYALIHAAYASQMTDRKTAEATNIQGSQKLLALSRQYGVGRFVFVSSMSAHDEAVSYYGQSKRCVEKMLDPELDLIVRPGLIIGPGGLFQRMRESIRLLPLVPLFYGGKQQIQIIWVKDLCRAIEAGLEQDLTGFFNIASEPPVFMREFYTKLAQVLGKTCHFVPLPGETSLLVLRLLEGVRIKLPVSSENLLGLKAMKVFAAHDDMNRLGIKPMSLDEALGELSKP